MKYHLKNYMKLIYEQFFTYKDSLLLFDLYNLFRPELDWANSNFNQHFKWRESSFKSLDNSKYKVGTLNKISNRVACLNNKIPLDWLNKGKLNMKWCANENFYPANGLKIIFTSPTYRFSFNSYQKMDSFILMYLLHAWNK